jgi:hypothetical protein
MSCISLWENPRNYLVLFKTRGWATDHFMAVCRTAGEQFGGGGWRWRAQCGCGSSHDVNDLENEFEAARLGEISRLVSGNVHAGVVLNASILVSELAATATMSFAERADLDRRACRG